MHESAVSAQADARLRSMSTTTPRKAHALTLLALLLPSAVAVSCTKSEQILAREAHPIPPPGAREEGARAATPSPSHEVPQISPGEVAADPSAARRQAGALGYVGPGDVYMPPPGSAPAITAQPSRPGEQASTFAIDVDTASYSHVRRVIEEGGRPSPSDVRIEEMLNYFTYDDAPPTNGDAFALHAETGPCPWDGSRELVRVALRARSLRARPDKNLVLLVDVSGSMSTADKLPRVQRALMALTEELTANDRIAIVVYSGQEGVALPTTSGSERTRIQHAIRSLAASGSTNGGAGIELAYRLARAAFVPGGVNRVVLATDGDFNVGVTSHGDLVRLIERERDAGVFLTVLGVGTHDLRDGTMEALADHGNGNYAYLDSDAEAERVLVREAGQTLVAVARDVKIQVAFDPDRVRSHRLVGYENRAMSNADFHDPSRDAGELGAEDSVVALYEVELVDRDDGVLGFVRPPLGDVRARYVDLPRSTREERSLSIRRGASSLSETSPDFRFSAAVAAFGLTLRGPSYGGDVSLTLVRALASGSLGRDVEGERAGFLRLVDRSMRSDAPYARARLGRNHDW